MSKTSANAAKPDKVEKMTRHDLYQTKPATGLRERWRDCTPLGNGYTGLTFYGGTSADVLGISRSDLWTGGHEAGVPDVSYVLQEMRSLQKEGKVEEACGKMYDALNNAGYSTNVANMRTLGAVKCIFECNGVYRHYRRILHMDTAEAQVKYQLDDECYERSCFVSRKRDMIVMRILSESPSGFSLEAGFYDSYEPDAGEAVVKAHDAQFAAHTYIDDCMVYSSKNEGSYFGMAVKAVSNGTVTVTDRRITVSGATDSLILIKAFSRKKNRKAAEQSTVKAVNACPTDYALLLEEHKRLYARLYNKADIKLYSGRTFHSNEVLLADARETECSPELAEKIWRFGRYLFISGVAKKGLPFALYGLWPCGYQRPWSQHVGNENVQIIHWHAAVGGLDELVRPLIEFYYDRMEGFRENAKALFGCNGIFIGAYLSPDNSLMAPHVPVILHFLGVAGWLSRHFYEYYLCTRDEKLFEEKILPFMLEAASFYEDYVYEDENGRIELYPAVSPENSPAEFQNIEVKTASGHPMPVTKNPTIEFAIMKELLGSLVEISKTHKKLEARVGRWKEMLSKIPEYKLNQDGAVAEWMDEKVHDCYAHRHLSHVYPLFPGTEIEDSGRLELIPAFKKAVDMRELGYMTGWSLAHMSAIYARLQESDKVFEMLNMLTKVCLLDNFFTLHNDYRGMGITVTDMGNEIFAPVQLDALMGGVNALQEMLVFVSAKTVKLLPACSKRFAKGSAKLHFFDGQIRLQWDEERQYCKAEFTAVRDTSFTLVLPFEKGRKELSLKAGEKYVLSVGQ